MSLSKWMTIEPQCAQRYYDQITFFPGVFVFMFIIVTLNSTKKSLYRKPFCGLFATIFKWDSTLRIHNTRKKIPILFLQQRVNNTQSEHTDWHGHMRERWIDWFDWCVRARMCVYVLFIRGFLPFFFSTHDIFKPAMYIKLFVFLSCVP